MPLSKQEVEETAKASKGAKDLEAMSKELVEDSTRIEYPSLAILLRLQFAAGRVK